jgi:sigma-B regulation protein RsbU (phosphoserine phosphatase)
MTTDELVVDVSQEWVLACHVQQRFMHGRGRSADSVDYSAQCRQVRALGGDCYDFMPLTDDRLALTVGDASGKGLAAALMIANVQSSLRTAAVFTGNDLAALLKVVNHQAYTSSLAERYATVFYGVFDRVVSARCVEYGPSRSKPPRHHCSAAISFSDRQRRRRS